MPAHVVLVHGLWGGPWSWDAVVERLDAADVTSSAVALPMRSLDEDASVVTSRLDEIADPVVLVGHSYGGAVITQAGNHPQVRELVYLAAFQLVDGESVNSVLPDRGIPGTALGSALQIDGDVIALDPELATGLLYNATAPEVAAAAMTRAVPVSRAVFRGVPTAFAWRDRPSTYVVCQDDLCVNPDLQRAMAERADTVLEWPGDHSPLVSRPDDVAALLFELASSL